MAQKPSPAPLAAPVVDPRREVASLRAAQAPVIFFEAISSFGARSGVVNMTLEGGLHYVLDGKTIDEPHSVAHLRFPLAAIANIRAALDTLEESLKPVPEELKN